MIVRIEPMRNYKVYLEHEQRRSLDAGRDCMFLEHVAVAVEADDGEEAVKRAREPLAQPERWKVRCVVLE